MSQGFDQMCGQCGGNRYITVERVGTWDGGKTYETIQDSVTCPTCQGAGRIGGQSQ